MENLAPDVQFFSDPKDANVLTKFGICHGFIAKKEASVFAPAFHHLNQVHGKKIVEAGSNTSFDLDKESRAAADGIYTSTKNIPIAIKTADCLPIILCAKERDLLVGVHAGWRGICQGIVPEALKLFTKRAKPLVLLGPCISKTSFEIGPELVPSFSALGLSKAQLDAVLSKGELDRWHADIGLCALFMLLNADVKGENISVLRSCTKENEELWHSYRREGKAFEPNWTWASL